MLQENYLRLAMVLNDNNAKTVNTNIVKILKTVVFTINNTPLTINKIAEIINEMYGLEFTQGEILNALKRNKPEGIECVVCGDPVYNTYRLTPEEYKKIEDKLSIKPLDTILEQFLESDKSISLPFDEIKDLIFDFLYNAFSTDVETIKALLGKNFSDVLSNGIFDNMENEQKLIINSFLNWNNSDKNKFVYNAISCGFEYCMLGLKKDNNSFSNIFRGKVFYLDSNIVFRLMGLNKDERKNVITAFIKRCIEVGIEIKYTNVTMGEINSAIDYYVNYVQNFYGSNTTVSRQAIQQLSGKYANLDFLDEYNKWTRYPGNKIGDYASFNKYLKKLADKTLSPYKMEPYESYENHKNKIRFQELFDELVELKRSLNKTTYEGTIRVDVNNYLFIRSKNENHLGESVLGVNNYIISADHTYINWAKSKLPNTIPIIVLPSVWYSIILKYNGRADNDYRAFSQFLKLSTNDSDHIIDKKQAEILATVLELNEPSDVKEEIIFDIASKLKNEYKDIESIEEIVQLSSDSVILQKVNFATEAILNENKNIIDVLKQETDEKLKKESQNSFEIGYKEGSTKYQQSIYEKIVSTAEKEANSKCKQFWFLRILFWAIPALVGITISAIIYFNFNGIIAYISFSFGPLFSAFMNILKGDRYKNIKNNTNKKLLTEKIIQQKCNDLGLLKIAS